MYESFQFLISYHISVRGMWKSLKRKKYKFCKILVHSDIFPEFLKAGIYKEYT